MFQINPTQLKKNFEPILNKNLHAGKSSVADPEPTKEVRIRPDTVPDMDPRLLKLTYFYPFCAEKFVEKFVNFYFLNTV
jgi:hypothetical protein